MHLTISGDAVNTVDSDSSGLTSRPGSVNELCSWARRCTLTVPLSTHVEYKWVSANCQGGLIKCKGRGCRGRGNLAMD